MVVVLASSVGSWFLPDAYLHYVFSFLIMGLLFDVLSLVCHLATLITGKLALAVAFVGHHVRLAPLVDQL